MLPMSTAPGAAREMPLRTAPTLAFLAGIVMVAFPLRLLGAICSAGDGIEGINVCLVQGKNARLVSFEWRVI